MDASSLLPILLAAAWLAPLASFAALALAAPRGERSKRLAGLVATGAILLAAVLSQAALWGVWLPTHGASPAEHLPALAADSVATAYAGQWHTLGQFGQIKLSIGYYIDALTVVMFALVTLVAACVHVYSFGYMAHEMDDELIDPEARDAAGRPITRRGRFHRFHQSLSLFSFSMLGLVLAGNLLMVFVFWELVGIASYLLIGFYYERPRAAAAAMKAFVVNRIGDAGLLVGLAALLTGFGTLDFGPSRDSAGGERPGLFRLAQGRAEESPAPAPALQGPAVEGPAVEGPAAPGKDTDLLLLVAGLGIFCGCVGKSAQAPLHVWLPDAMEGPTPVSALVHSATMVAAGVYLVGRCYPLLLPQTLLVIAVVGCGTMCLGATVAVAASDIKRVLAWSTVSQLGLMMLGLGTGGWVAALFHLITHATFKGLLFLGAGSVIHALGTNELAVMGGLRRKMPWTAGTMLIGCLAIAGAGVPLVIGLSGYYSKDAIIAQTLAFRAANPGWPVFFHAAVATTGVTSFYMFRVWYLTFAGAPRDRHKYEHAHESPRSMVAPLLVLAALAIGVGWRLGSLGVEPLLKGARPAAAKWAGAASFLPELRFPSADAGEAFHGEATWIAIVLALGGFLLATMFYGLRLLDPREARQQFAPIYRLLRNAWHVDQAYKLVIVGPIERLSRLVAAGDRRWIDGLIDSLARGTRWLARREDAFDRHFVDGAVDGLAKVTYQCGLSLRGAQTGRLRQYVLFIVVGALAMFMLISFTLDGD